MLSWSSRIFSRKKRSIMEDSPLKNVIIEFLNKFHNLFFLHIHIISDL